MPLLAGPQDLLGILEARDQLLARRRLHRLPDLPGRLALDSRQMAERHADRRADRCLWKVGAEWRLEIDEALADELNDENGRERLRDRADPVHVVGGCRARRGDVGNTEHPLPDDLAVAEHAGRDRRHPLLRLRGLQQTVELCPEQ